MRSLQTSDLLKDWVYQSQESILSFLRLVHNATLLVLLTLLVYAVGWDLSADQVSSTFRWMEALLGVVVIEFVLRTLVSLEIQQYLRENWLETAMVLLYMVLGLLFWLGIDILYWVFLWLWLPDFNAMIEGLLSIYIMVLGFLGMARASRLLGKIQIEPATTFIFSFVFLIFAGGLALMLPAMTTIPGSMRFIDALFTSASAACVTGLAVQDTATFFTFKGQVVILVLIQLGGIGIVTFATFFATFLSQGVGLKQQAVIQDVLSTESLASARQTLRQIIMLTFLIEAIGAVAVFCAWSPDVQFHTPVPQWELTLAQIEQAKKQQASADSVTAIAKNQKNLAPAIAADSTNQADSISAVEAPVEILIVEEAQSEAPPAPTPDNKRLNNTLANKIWYSIFHSVSAFCNAGFSLFSGGLYEPVVDRCYVLHLIIAFVIIFGSLGYTTINEVFSPAKMRERMRTPWKQWSLGTQIAMNMTIILIVVGGVLYFFLEQQHTLQGKNLYEQIITSFFQAVTPRTAGFNTVDMSLKGISEPTWLLIIFLMFIGAASGSTGGGIKTSTFFLIVYSAIASITNKKNVEIGKRTIPTDTINRAFSIVAFAISYNAICVFLLSIVQPADIRELFFEQISAFATVGLSNGITPSLNDYAKSIIIFTMYVGRVGTLTLALALTKKALSTSYRYPSAYVMVG